MTKTTPHMERVEAAFTALLECPVEQRQDRLQSLCGDDLILQAEVESLVLAADKAKGFLSMGPLQASVGAPSPDSDSMLGQRFDSWQIVRELDSGGMGIVFLAERIDGHYQQKVAIKLAKLGLTSDETVSRFHTERQILANLHHPNIAQLLDGGTGPDGYPYLVMEYVQGEDIETWCDSQRLSVEQILSLMITVCDAVQYAHRNLIVHCDLKPSNILVSDGVPTLLDFGIATLLEPSLASGESVLMLKSNESPPMTPTFAAPEQIRGEPVTTTTDIYALGVVLYRLLSGKYPYSIVGASRSEIIDSVDNVNIPPPSSKAAPGRKSELQGDLDRIVLKALQKDPQQRYNSPKEFSTDIQQYLEGFPVSVSPNFWWYIGGKFIKRHKWSVTLSVVAVASLWVGSFFSIWQWQVARDKQSLAEQRFNDVRNMINTLVVDLPTNIASQPGSTPLRVQLLDQGIAELDNLVKTQSDNPGLIRELAVAYAALARLQGYPASVNLGEPAKAAATYEKSLSLQHDLLSEFDNDVEFIIEIATNYSALTLINFTALRETRRAYEYADKCEAILTPWIPSGHPEVLRWLTNCYTLEAKWHSDDRNYLEAKEAVSTAHEIIRSQASNHAFVKSYNGYRTLARVHEEWAEIESNIGSKEKALEHERLRMDITLSHLQDDQGSVLLYGPARITGDAYHAYAARLASVDKLVEAEEAYLLAVETWISVRRRFPSDASATRSLVYLYSDYAELHRQISATLHDKRSIRTRNRQACANYQLSLENVNKISGDSEKLAKRYSWSLRPKKIRQRYEALCVPME